jgi:DNA recombination protein RmuC
MNTLFIALIATALFIGVSLLIISRSLNNFKNRITAELKEGQQYSVTTLTQLASLTQSQLEQLTNQTSLLSDKTENRLNLMNQAIDAKLEKIRVDNEQKLEQMRVTVDEKLHSTLEKRLGESFKLVSEQLSTVNKSLGEMQSLADGVGDLKKVLTNVKTRGMMGEFQLHAILRDILTPEQYKENVVTKALSNERVEFAVRLPGIEKDKEILLPIDAKFPKEDYEKLIDSQQKQVLEEVEIHRKALRQRMKTEAKRIAEKYIDVPNTTDFALLFLPFEGLYAEVLNTPGLVDEMQREYRVVVAGPTTLAALLNSLQMGFRTLAIQKRSSEVWHLLSRIKTEFDRFGLILEKTKKRLDLAAGDLDLAYRRSEKIKRQLSATQTENNLLSEKTEEIT